jgi:outer membrane protein OmpA-like peptidoglycan-associated protein
MITLKKACLLATVSFALSSAAYAAPAFDVVKDTNRNIVKNTFGNCVITKWDSVGDECTGKAVANISKDLLNVYFDFNKSTLNSKEKTKLDTVSKLIKESKEVEAIDIAGFADNIGKDGYNKKLSQRRAETVKSYLAKRGLKARKLTVEAFGETNPVTKCDPSLAKKDLIACLAEDRRVEIKLITKN